VAILVAHPDTHVVHAVDGLQGASRAGPIVANLSCSTAGLAARGFDEPAMCAFLGANWLRTLEVVLP